MVETSMKDKIKKDLEQDPLKTKAKPDGSEGKPEVETNKEQPGEEKKEEPGEKEEKEASQEEIAEAQERISQEVNDLNNNGYFRFKLLEQLERINNNLEDLKKLGLEGLKK